MGDVAREQLDEDIARAIRSEQMLRHLATVVEESAQGKRRRAYPDDAHDALMHGAELARREAQNLEHVRVVYDAKVNSG